MLGKDTSAILLTATFNSGSKPRTETIIVSDNGTLSDTVFVTQAATAAGVIDLSGSRVMLYLIPVTGCVTITYPDIPDQTSIFIYTMDGIEVYASQLTASMTTLDMSTIKPGVYVVKLFSPGYGLITKKLIKN